MLNTKKGRDMKEIRNSEVRQEIVKLLKELKQLGVDVFDLLRYKDKPTETHKVLCNYEPYFTFEEISDLVNKHKQVNQAAKVLLNFYAVENYDSQDYYIRLIEFEPETDLEYLQRLQGLYDHLNLTDKDRKLRQLILSHRSIDATTLKELKTKLKELLLE